MEIVLWLLFFLSKNHLRAGGQHCPFFLGEIMKTHFNFKEINKLIDLATTDLHQNIKENIKAEPYGVVYKNTDEGFLLEEILAKLICAKKKCEVRYRKKLEYQDKN